MKRKTTLSLLIACVAVVTLAAGCSSSSKSTTGGGNGGGGATTSSTAPAVSTDAQFVALHGWKDPACSTTKPKVVVGISDPIDVAGTSLVDYVDGAQAAVVAFNERGGINGRCLDLKVCDGKGDGPTELSCARQETGNTDMVAGLASTFEASEGDAYQLFESAGLAQVGAQVTQPGGWNSPVSYDFTMGGSGTLLAGMPALKNVGVTKFVVFVPASGQVGAFASFANPLVKALGMNLQETIQIPPTAVEFTQFVLAAQNKGAEGGVLGLPQNTGTQIVNAADSVGSNLKLATSWAQSQNAVAGLPTSVSKNMAFTDAVPPAVANSSRWPIFNVIINDFKAAGKADLAEGAITAEATNGWLSVYALVKVMRDAKATNVTRATVKAAFDKATNVPMFGLIPPWTPAKQSTNAIFKGISNPMYWTGHWDASAKQFVVDDKQVNVLALLGN